MIIYPPRPRGRIIPHELARYEKTGEWLIQRKFNGTRTVIIVTADRKIEMWDRHGKAHKAFSLDKNVAEQILSLNYKPGTYCLDGEILSFKTKQIKNTIVLFDVLMAEGAYLFGKPKQPERLVLLADICRNPTKHEPYRSLALEVTPNIWMAETWDKDFVQHYQEVLDSDEIEGLMLRERNATIDHFGHVEYEVTWQLRCRKPHKNYNY